MNDKEYTQQRKASIFEVINDRSALITNRKNKNPMASFEAEQLSLLDVEELNPGNEFPTILARLPIFPAHERKKQREFLDLDNALVFETVFGSGRRHGPPVNTDDEDRLFALMRLRKKKLKGSPELLPVPLSNTSSSVNVHYLSCTIREINEEMGLTHGGKNYSYTLQCLKRLAAVTVEIEVKKHDLYFGNHKKGSVYKLVDIVWDCYSEDALIKVQFPPLVAEWLESNHSFINWNQRKKLKSRNIKALHRYLSTQGKYHEKDLIKIAETIGWEGERRRMKQMFTKMMNELKEVGFVDEYELAQEKKRMPFTLKVVRK